MIRFELGETIEILRQTPDTLTSMLAGLSPEWTQSSGHKDNWSPYDVIGHLIHGEKTDWIPRAEIILAQGEDRTFEPYDRLAQFEISRGKSLRELLNEFAGLRRSNIDKLIGWQLSPEQFRLTGVHPAFGSVTLAQLFATWAVHDLTHIQQIVRHMASQYSDAVGPWREYLSILKK